MHRYIQDADLPAVRIAKYWTLPQLIISYPEVNVFTQLTADSQSYLQQVALV